MALDITLRQLRYFQAVAEHGTYTRAAEVLLVSQPTISAAVKDLERQVGLPLLEPLHRRVCLTEAGRVVLRTTERILGMLEDAEAQLAEFTGGYVGRLTLGASSTPGTYLLPLVLRRYLEARPRAEVMLEVSDTQEILGRVIDGRIDLGVVGEAHFDAGLVSTHVCRDQLVLILPPTHRLAAQSEVALADLTGEAWVMREAGSSTRAFVEAGLGAREFSPRVLMELSNTEAIKKAVAAGLGVAIVSAHATELERQTGTLIVRQLADLELKRGVYLVRRSTFRSTPAHDAFVAELMQTAGMNGENDALGAMRAPGSA